MMLLSFSYSKSAQCQPSIIEHQIAQFTSEWQAVVNRRIWMNVPWRAAEFRKPTCRIWRNFPRKTVVPTHDTGCMLKSVDCKSAVDSVWWGMLFQPLPQCIILGLF